MIRHHASRDIAEPHIRETRGLNLPTRPHSQTVSVQECSKDNLGRVGPPSCTRNVVLVEIGEVYALKGLNKESAKVVSWNPVTQGRWEQRELIAVVCLKPSIHRTPEESRSLSSWIPSSYRVPNVLQQPLMVKKLKNARLSLL